MILTLVVVFVCVSVCVSVGGKGVRKKEGGREAEDSDREMRWSEDPCTT